jgi:RNA polymerase sigma factor (sigma-70 family)
MTDDELMKAYRAGDVAAFRQLFAVYAPRLHGFFLRAFRSGVIADDLLQTTFMKLHRARKDYRIGAAVRPWLFSIAARVRLDELRRMRRLPEDCDEEAVARAEEPVGAWSPARGPGHEDDRAVAVQAALNALPESQRTVIHLHRFEGLTFPEIAAALGTTEGAVKLRAFRGYERLRKDLAPLVGAREQSA